MYAPITLESIGTVCIKLGTELESYLKTNTFSSAISGEGDDE